MKEILSFHIGQAGVQMGNAVWELLCLDHSLTENGTSFYNCVESNTDIFFQQISNDVFVPRSVFIDLDRTVIDEIRTGSYRSLYHPDRLITGPEDAAGNFARGFFSVGKMILPIIDLQIRKLFESCDSVQALILYRSLSGGTGAGLTSAMLESLAEYPKTTKIELSLFPSASISSSTVEPYNSLLAEHFSMEDIELGMLNDNESLYDISNRFLANVTPTFSAINRLCAQIISNITATIRFQGLSTSDITIIQSNIVPYPRIHHPLCNISPLLDHKTQPFEEGGVQEITRTLFTRENQMLKVDTFLGKYISCFLCYRGMISVYDVFKALAEIKQNKSVQFVDWCPTGFKVSISLTPPVVIPGGYVAPTEKNVVMLTNTSAIGQAWQRLTHKFYMLYSKRAFIHWFVGEGIEECEFTESLYNISSLVKDYEEITIPSDAVPSNAQSTGKVSPTGRRSRQSEHSVDVPNLFVPPSSVHVSSKLHDENIVVKLSNDRLETQNSKDVISTEEERNYNTFGLEPKPYIVKPLKSNESVEFDNIDRIKSHESISLADKQE